MTKPSFIITALAFITLSIYLFVQAPAPLPVEGATMGKTIPIETILRLVAAENDVVRTQWTGDIVGAGKKVGLQFDEHWRDEGVEAGPLPALFLRETATNLDKDPVLLSLFLGSDFPITPANKFTGPQVERFEAIKKTQEPQFFYAEDTQIYTAMFADYASVEACVACHNNHPDSPKKDWKLGDIMGATTWAYPKKAVTLDELMDITTAVRKAFRDAYTAYLEKTKGFSKPPNIGKQWPSDGYYLPDVDTFMTEFSRRASAGTVALLLKATHPEPQNTPTADLSSGSSDRNESGERVTELEDR